ncbi:MAG: amidohydrolase family protein [Verrucomicrobia bacterium]|nr:amidohydrolase family protein [Verrucomicrobiota bacterium]
MQGRMVSHTMTTTHGPIDVHVHLSGNGKGGMDCWHRQRWIMKPFLWAGARDIGLKCGFADSGFDRMYLDQLLHWLSTSSLEAAVLLAEDWVRDDRGAVRKDLTDFFISNDKVFTAVKRSAKLLAGVSIHPARPDAVDELERCAAAGAVLLKLLPCVQNVDCNLSKYKPFWIKLADLGLPLLAHTGGEFFVRSCRNDLKSPGCLRLPLECGVTVIAAHCSTRALPWDGDYFEEFLQMRKDFQNFYGDLAALSHITHLKSLERLREEPERLLHGTDYPVVTAVFPSWLKGWIDRETMQHLRGIHNPLEKKIQLTKALGFPERVFTDLWGLLPRAPQLASLTNL